MVVNAFISFYTRVSAHIITTSCPILNRNDYNQNKIMMSSVSSYPLHAFYVPTKILCYKLH